MKPRPLSPTLEDLIQPKDRIILRVERIGEDGEIIRTAHSIISGETLQAFRGDIGSLLELELRKAYEQFPKETC